MVRQRVFRQSRAGKLAMLMIWVMVAAGDIYVVAKHLRSLSPMHWIMAAIWLIAAVSFIRVVAYSLGAADNE